MRVTVDETLCEANGFCESIAPDIFEIGRRRRRARRGRRGAGALGRSTSAPRWTSAPRPRCGSSTDAPAVSVGASGISPSRRRSTCWWSGSDKTLRPARATDAIAARAPLVEHRPQLRARQHRTQAVVRAAAAESDMRVGLPTDVKGERGTSKTSSSRLAERSIDTTRSPLGMCWPSISTSTLAVRRPVRHRRRPAQHLLDGAGPTATSSSRYRSIWSGLATNACSPMARAFLVVSLPANASTKKKNSSSFAGRLNCSPSSPVIDRGCQRAPDVVGGIAAAFPRSAPSRSRRSRRSDRRPAARLGCASGVRAFRMRSKQSKTRGRSSSGMPMMSPMTVIGSASATSSIQSPPPLASRSSIIRAARARMPSSSLAIARGLKALEMSLRRLFSSGGSNVDDGWVRGEQVGRLDERAIGGGERIGITVQAHGVPVFGGHPEIPFARSWPRPASSRGGTAAWCGAARRTTHQESRCATMRNRTGPPPQPSSATSIHSDAQNRAGRRWLTRHCRYQRPR